MSDPVDPLALENQLCFGLVAAARQVVAFYRPHLEPPGLTHPQYLVMLALWQDGATTIRGLSDRLLLEPATVSPLVKRLEAAGLLTRLRDPGDERVVRVGLTSAGEQLRARATAVPVDVGRRLGIEPARLLELRDRLGELVSRMEER